MGMYTELVLKCGVNFDSMGKIEKQVFDHLFNNGEHPERLPSHPFFECSRWDQIGTMSSFYHHPKPIKSVHEDYLFSRSDLKNYDNEVQLFIDWFSPFVSENAEQCIGWEWYEESDAPTLIYPKR